MSDNPADVLAGRYRLGRQLGQGGMGRVWAARDELLDRDVAVKELVPTAGLAAGSVREMRERAIREARAIARIDHRNVVRIFDVVHQGGAPWIVMELVPSRPLSDVVDQDGPLPPLRAAAIGLDVLAALRAAHRVGVLHRDVKPANVLLADDGRVVLTDFGLATATGDAAMTHTGVVLGSPAFLAPERALDGPTGPAADLWSLGATLYAAVEGRPPYDKSTPVATLAALCVEPPRAPRQAGVLQPALAALLRKDPAERADADEAERLLHSAAAECTPPIAPPAGTAVAGSPVADTASPGSMPAGTAVAGSPVADTASPGAVPASRRRRWWIGVAAVLVVAAALGARPVLDLMTAEGSASALAVGVGVGAAPRSSTPSPSHPSPPLPSAAGSTAATVPAGAVPSRAALATRSTGNRPAAPAPKPTTRPTTVPTTVIGKPFQNRMTGTCLDLANPGGDLRMWACRGTDAQHFSLASDGTLRVLGRCVRIRGTGDGARLGVGACTGSGAQFTYNSSDDLVSEQVDKCVDVPDGNAADAVPAQIWECTGADNQKWDY